MGHFPTYILERKNIFWKIPKVTLFLIKLYLQFILLFDIYVFITYVMMNLLWFRVYVKNEENAKIIP